ncbi:MAG: FAD-dependent oxidoreductase [Candidatus Omnitrophota bacterium]|nr:FAD-dependent oxidoreductase [Candidatus Omnitrophota bacterium]
MYVKVILRERIKRAPTVESFRFAVEEKISFLPGQFCQVIFDEKNPSDKELNKFLSLSSSPTKDYLEVTKRLSESRFSQKLDSLKPKDEVLLKIPLGTCIFKDEYKRVIFLIGGIGITPVASIIEYIMDKNLDTDVTLVYSNGREEEIAFKKELDAWQKINKNLKVFYTVTELAPKDKTILYSRINKDVLSKNVCDVPACVNFIFGPPKMVEAMENLCLELGCCKDNVKTEKFIGY